MVVAAQERDEMEISEMGSSCFEADFSEERREDEEPKVVAVEEEEVILWRGRWVEESWPRKSGEVMLEGYIDAEDGGEEGKNGVGRTKSLTDEDLEDLKGCLDLGFAFSYEVIPDLCSTLPALELCYSMRQRFLDEKQKGSLDRSSSGESVDLCPTPPSPPIANWKISCPGDDPDDVKARLKYWAQAVACTIRLCN
ncbi:uncharacterized protein LOC121991512 [Zingiber officinale]|uniref:Uncharacterized protein n=1 Tax=Zingiber officinale TaxID=94328 RepID=A0A8J5HZG9_ZINOF|nr:uncharacterized protein LOC121991512 [Zingiber officinale]KAG6534932.1 hypothetical protein ZIOFF_008840 [Zingiber officinale]